MNAEQVKAAVRSSLPQPRNGYLLCVERMSTRSAGGIIVAPCEGDLPTFEVLACPPKSELYASPEHFPPQNEVIVVQPGRAIPFMIAGVHMNVGGKKLALVAEVDVLAVLP